MTNSDKTPTDDNPKQPEQWFKFKGKELHLICVEKTEWSEVLHVPVSTVRRIILTFSLNDDGKLIANWPENPASEREELPAPPIGGWCKTPESALLENNPDLKKAIDCWNLAAEYAEKFNLGPAIIPILENLATHAMDEEFKRVTCGTKPPPK